jgi:hypothetical protein
VGHDPEVAVVLDGVCAGHGKRLFGQAAKRLGFLSETCVAGGLAQTARAVMPVYMDYQR